MSDDFLPLIPVNGRVLVEELPFKPSKTIECISIDRADATEAIVRRLSPKKFGRRYVKSRGWETNGQMFDHDVKEGDRIIMKPQYRDDDVHVMNGKKFRILDPWDIYAVITEPQPEGFRHPITGDIIPDKHPIHILGA